MHTQIYFVCLTLVVGTAFVSVFSNSNSNLEANSALQGLSMTWIYQAVFFLAASIK